MRRGLSGAGGKLLMARILIVCGGSTKGQTGKIAGHIAQKLRDRNHTVEVVDSTHLPDNFCVEGFDAAILGAAVRMQKFPQLTIEFAKSNRAFLERVPSAFFSVCMAAASPLPDKRQQAQTWNEIFFNETGWRPRLASSFAGALHYRKYNFLLRFMMKRIARAEGVSTDTSRNHEYTDWEAVSRFADELAGLL